MIGWLCRLTCLAVVISSHLLAPAWADATATAKNGMIASVHPLATEAGLEVLQSGGNAIDAAVAVGLTLGVVDSHNSGIGGGCFMLIRLADGTFVAIDGREKAPAAATRDMFLRDGRADTSLSQIGPLASGVPGELAAFDHAVRRHGRKELRDLLLPAAKIAEEGIPVSPGDARRITRLAEVFSQFEGSHAEFFRDGEPLKAGEIWKKPDLANTYRQIAEQGINWFYRGPFARAAGEWMRANGGILTAQDFADYEVAIREPVRTRYRGYTVVSFPPPSSGGVHLVQMLNILERFNLRKLDEATRLHVIAESMKLAFADRAHWLGDPDFADVPRGLVSTRYARELAKRIDPDRVSEVGSHGHPPGWENNFFGKHTTHWSVADAEGNWVACTATINTSYGSKVVIPGTGVVMNNEMDDFSAQPGVANYFGLIGAEANAIEPGKRPLSSMTPTIVLKGRRPVIALGAAGGPRIITAVLLELVNMLDLEMSAEEAVAAARIHHQWSPDELTVEERLPDELKEALREKGHTLNVVGASAVSQIVWRNFRTGKFEGASDPRTVGSAAGW